MSRFVRPETTTLHISDGDTLTVKRRLNAGETRAMFARMYRAMPSGRLRVDPLDGGLAIVLAYLVDWSLVDDNQAHVDIRGCSADDLAFTLDALEPDDFTEIKDAIEAHENRMAAERAEEKKTRRGATPSALNSPSPVAVAGPSRTSDALTPMSTTS